MLQAWFMFAVLVAPFIVISIIGVGWWYELGHFFGPF